MCGSVAWAALSDETPFTVGRSSSPGFDLEIQDLPPSAPVKDQLPDADLYIVPTLLDGGSFAVYLHTIEILRRPGKGFLPVANRVNLRRSEHPRRLAEPSLAGAIVIPDRAALASYYEWARPFLPCGARVWRGPGRIFCGWAKPSKKG
jgi:chromosome partitioning protein